MNWSWVATADLVAERRDNARELVGSRLSAVSYVLLDYGRPDRPDGSKGPQLIAEATELASPTWRCGTFDWADHAVEFTTAARRVFTCSWDAPGCHEGIWLREAPARGTAYAVDANVAIWDVSHSVRWDSFIGTEITDLSLHYAPWPGGGYWCPRITIAFGDRLVYLLLGDADADADADERLVPSSDNIAVLFSPALLPDWAADD